MPGFAGLGTSIVLIIAVVLWVAYLVPVWTRKREYLATERNAIRLQQTLRIMAESQEAPEEVRLEVDARTVAVQQKAVAKEQRLKQALEHAKAVARARELDEQIKAVEREVRAAVKSSMSRTQRLRRTRLACFALVVVALLGVVAGALVPALQVLVAVGAAVAVLGVVGLVAVNSSAQRMRRVAASTAPQVRTLVEARKVAAEAVAAEERMAEQVVARQSGRIDRLATAEVLESRSWSPQPVPEQRVRVEYKASDDLLQRAREQLAADRRVLSAPVARVTRLEPSFEEIVTGEVAQTETERRLAPTQPAVPIRELPLQAAVAQAEALDVVRAEQPLETQPDEHPIRREQPARRAPATTGSRFASMGLIDDDLGGVDVLAAFARRVG
jgi:hypothetical protein